MRNADRRNCSCSLKIVRVILDSEGWVMGTTYDQDVVAWAHEQAEMLRSGRLADLDIQHIAEEIEDVAKSEQRELANRMAILLVHLLKWKSFRPERRGASWAATIKARRNSVERRIRKMPSLKTSLADPDWWADAWEDAAEAASKETGIAYADFPATCPWSPEEVMDQDFFPGADNIPRQ